MDEQNTQNQDIQENQNPQNTPTPQPDQPTQPTQSPQPAISSSETPETSPLPEDVEIPDDLSNDEVFDIFIYGIMDEKGVEVPTTEIRQTLHDDLKEQLMFEINRTLIAALPDEKLNEFYNRAQKNDTTLTPEEITSAIEGSDINVMDIITSVMTRFRDAYLNPEKYTKNPTEDNTNTDSNTETNNQSNEPANQGV